MLDQNELIKSIADTLRQARHRKGYTLEKLADESNIDYSTVSLIENGKQNPRIYTIYKLLYTLDIDITVLLGAKSMEMKNEKDAILNRLALLDLATLESIDALLARFSLVRK